MELDINMNDYLKTGFRVTKWFYTLFSLFLIYSFMPELLAFVAAVFSTIMALSVVSYHWRCMRLVTRKQRSGYNMEWKKKEHGAGFAISFGLLSLAIFGLLQTFPFFEMVVVNAN